MVSEMNKNYKARGNPKHINYNRDSDNGNIIGASICCNLFFGYNNIQIIKELEQVSNKTHSIHATIDRFDSYYYSLLSNHLLN